MSASHSIHSALRGVRNRLASATLRHELLLSGFLLALLASTLIWYEKSLYLGTGIRSLLAWGFLDLTLIAGLVVLLRWFGIWRGWWRWVRPEALADRIGYKIGRQADRLLNALQLERRLEANPHQSNSDLLADSVQQVSGQLAKMDLGTLTPRRYKPPRRLVILGLFIILSSWLTGPTAMLAAMDRLLHPEQEFPAPAPFILLALTGDLNVLGGDTVEVAFTGFDVVPTSVELVWEDKAGALFSEILPLDGDRFTYRFEDIRDDVTYYARYRNPSWFSPWTQIETEKYRISISDRPIIEEMQFIITPPAYTGDESRKLGGNVADIAALAGSEIAFTARTNLTLKDAWLELSGDAYPVNLNRKKLTGKFMLETSTTMIVRIMDRRDVMNLRPIHYRITALEDFPPTITVILPPATLDLDESMLVPIPFDATDDYGFSQAIVSYNLRHPEYLLQDDKTYTALIPGLQPNRRSQRILHTWQLGSLNLLPGDEVHFRIEVDDNNLATGPGRAVSATFVARVPTLAALFDRINSRNAETAMVTEGVLEDLKDVQKLLDELDLATRDKDDIRWEEQQKGKELIQNLEEILNSMESVQEQLRELGSKAESNKLFSEEVQKKYADLQNLLEEIMTPELQSSMNELREALESLDPEQMQLALKNLRFNADEFELQLDRYLDVFRRAQAEMKMDEVAQRLDDLAETEQQLLDELRQTPPGDESKLRNLVARHQQQERSLDAAKETMRSAANAIRPYSASAGQRLEELRNSPMMRAAEQSLVTATQSLGQGNSPESNADMMESQASVSAVQREARDIQREFQEANVGAMLAEFQAVMNQTLALSHRQEALAVETELMSRTTPRVSEMALRQHQVIQGHKRLIEQLMALGRQTFAVSPEMGRAMGKSLVAMRGAVERLTANSPQAAAKLQSEGMEGLNQTALALNNAMAEMRRSGSASGFEQFLERMRNLAQGQQGLNNQSLSLQLGQMGAMNQLELQRRLQARQRQLAQALEQIMEDYPTQNGGKSGGLGQARNEMEDVIADFNRRRITRRTIDRQQNILNRLLDSQKSLSEQDFRDERRGRSPTEQLAYEGADELPADLGQREDLILQSMEKALRSGYSREYQAVMRTYFQRLAAARSSHP